ncbi:tail fiber protein [Chromobacterium violaceum]|uniref:tail fiber protein n=1 Tax=Chromobacterium violaceum TaxID=536 RepID=UPI001E34E0F0|nr:tail fiber protein [Chromobacterium violaceum]MCD0491420.1 tail fiber protein [Chromobacterium violaceum]
MQDVMQPINTPDKLFQDGNPNTGALGTIVTATWLNAVQGSVQSIQAELVSVLASLGISPDAGKNTQVLDAVRRIAWGGTSRPTTLAGYGIGDALPMVGDLAEADLNSVVATGIYHNRLSVNAKTEKNYPPVGEAGMLIVYPESAMVYQQYQCYAVRGIWYRCRYSGTWQPWRRLADAATTLAGYGITDGATKAELKAAVDGLVSGAPGALDTLQELAAALGNDNNFAATITNKLAGKADKSSSLAGYGIGDAMPMAGDIGTADLNAVTNTGIYNQALNANALLARNYPVTEAGILQVVPVGDMVYQQYQCYAAGGFWYRCRNKGTWTAWQQCVTAGSGMIAYFASNTTPAGWLRCDGSAASRTTYPALFAAIGTTYGAGDGSTTFNLPDLRGEFVRGWSNGRPGVDVGRALGSWQDQDIQSHFHTIARDSSMLSAGGAQVDRATGGSLGNYADGATRNNGGTETRPRNVALLACIKI